MTQGPDGADYVGESTVFPFPAGGARAYRVVPRHEPEVIAESSTNIIDIAFCKSEYARATRSACWRAPPT